MASSATVVWRPGYCGTTDFASRLDVCSTRASGAWHMARWRTPQAAQDQCLKRCVRCANCLFVSYTVGECSWFSKCDMTRLLNAVPGFVTAEAPTSNPIVGARRRNMKRGHVQQSAEVAPRPRSQPPSALLFYHITRTGGTSLRQLISGRGWAAAHNLKAQQLRRPIVVKPHCFLALFPSVVLAPSTSASVDTMRPARRWCGSRGGQCGERDNVSIGHRETQSCPDVDWRSSDMWVEFIHRDDIDAWWDRLDPALPQLRLLFGAHNGTLITATVAREPKSLITSQYITWPPRVDLHVLADTVHRPKERAPPDHKRTLTTLTFDEALTDEALATHDRNWLSRMNSSLVRELAGSQFTGERTMVAQRLARQRLQSFDLVGVVECTRQLWRRLSARLPWDVLRDESIMDTTEAKATKDGFKPQERNYRFREFLAVSVDEERSPAARRALWRISSYDLPVYLDALRRAGLLSIVDDDVRTDDEEEAWLAESPTRPPNCNAVVSSPS